MTRIFILFSLILLASCQKNDSNTTNNEEPKALQEESISFGRSSGQNNLTDELYKGMVSQSPELKSLENELKNLNLIDTLNLFDSYNEKSENYYSSAKAKVNTLQDSILKIKILNLLKLSEDKYDKRTSDINSNIKTIYQKKQDLVDYHNILKILLTIPLIEKYQKDHLPKNDPFKKIIEKENQLIEKVKQNTPKY